MDFMNQTLKQIRDNMESAFLGCSPPSFDEESRGWLIQKQVARVRRWLTPNDALPEIPDHLKPKDFQRKPGCNRTAVVR